METKHTTPAPQMTAKNYDYLAHLDERLYTLRITAERMAKEYAHAHKYVLTAAEASMVYTTNGRRGKFTSRDLPSLILSYDAALEMAQDIKLADGSLVEITPLVSYLHGLRDYAARELSELETLKQKAQK